MTDVDRAGIPAAPPAPWRCTVSGVCWVQRAGDAARAGLPAPLRAVLRPQWVVGAFLRYAGSPVGPYTEVFAGLVQRRGPHLRAHVPFLAVDSPASVRGGRANWALPKGLAAFRGLDGDPPGRLRAAGDGWWLEADVRPLGPAIPLRGRVTCWQVGPGGVVTFPATLRGRGRPVRVRVRPDAGLSLGSWLRPGRHLGVALLDAHLDIGAARRCDPGGSR